MITQQAYSLVEISNAYKKFYPQQSKIMCDFCSNFFDKQNFEDLEYCTPIVKQKKIEALNHE